MRVLCQREIDVSGVHGRKLDSPAKGDENPGNFSKGINKGGDGI